MTERPLQGLKVLEMGQLLAGPFLRFIFRWIWCRSYQNRKAQNAGDPLRQWRKIHNRTSLWWLSRARNKKSITPDMTNRRGQEIAKKLAKQVDKDEQL